jgi:hypothetical protein
VGILKKKRKKIKRKLREGAEKVAARLDESERGMAPAPPDRVPVVSAEAAGSLRQPDYPEDALAAQQTPKPLRKKRSAIKRKTIRAMHLEVNRRIAAVGAEQTVLDPDMTDHEKFIQLTRQAGNIGDTLAGPTPAPELIHSELIRLMALSAAWAQSISGKR